MGRRAVKQVPPVVCIPILVAEANRPLRRNPR